MLLVRRSKPIFVLPGGMKCDVFDVLDSTFFWSLSLSKRSLAMKTVGVGNLGHFLILLASSDVVILTNSSRLRDCDWTFKILYVQCDPF